MNSKIIIFLIGCVFQLASAKDPSNPVATHVGGKRDAAYPRMQEDEWRKLVTLNSDEFSKEIRYAVKPAEDDLKIRNNHYFWGLNGFVDKTTSEESYLLRVINGYRGPEWRFWKYADSDTAEKLFVIKGKNDVDGCDRERGCYYTERIGIALTKAFVVRIAQTGRKIKITSNSGENFVLYLSSDQGSSLLSAMDDCKKTDCMKPKPRQIEIQQQDVPKPDN